MNAAPYEPPTFQVLPWMPDDIRWIFDIVMVIFVAWIIWDAHKNTRGW